MNWEQALTQEIPRLRRYARALTQNTAAADDLVQDCLERAWHKRRNWREGSNLRAWLFTILHNAFVNTARHNKRIQSHAHQALPVPGLDDGHKHELMDMQRCLARLRPEYREVVLLAGLEGMAYKDIATVINAPIGTVMSRLSRGREELRQMMSGGDSGETPDNVVRL